LMSVDAQRLQDLTSYLHAIWYSFLQIGLAIFFLWKYLGPSCMGGVSIIIIMIPVSKNVAAYQGKIQKQLMHVKDDRVDLNNEVLGCMKIIKLQAWEIPFQHRINVLRNIELDHLFRYILAIDVYDDGINIIAKQDNLSDESTDQLIAGVPHSTLSEMSSIAIKFLIVLFIEKGKCFANLGNRRATGSNYLDAYHVSI